MHASHARLIVFAKAPVPGQVKTRLASRLGSEQAARIHEWLTLHTLETATRHVSCPIELWCSPGTEHGFFQDCRQRYPLTLHTQQGEDLGARMAHAFASALGRGGHAVLIGTDCPILDGAHLDLAFDTLAQGHDAVLTPAADGGYVLIGLSRLSPLPFTRITWGTSKVYRETTAHLERLGWRWRELEKLWDIDTASDLDRLLGLESRSLPTRLQRLIGNLKTLAPNP